MNWTSDIGHTVIVVSSPSLVLLVSFQNIDTTLLNIQRTNDLNNCQPTKCSKVNYITVKEKKPLLSLHQFCCLYVSFCCRCCCHGRSRVVRSRQDRQSFRKSQLMLEIHGHLLTCLLLKTMTETREKKRQSVCYMKY